MKKEEVMVKRLVVSAAIVVIAISGCATAEEATEAEEAVEVAEEDSSAGIEVDEGLLNVEVTIPKEFFEDQTEEDIAATVEEAGYSSYVLNPDGSVTYTMSRLVYEATLQEMRVGIEEIIQESVNESPDVFTSITYDDAVSSFDVTVNRAAYESDMEAGFIGFTLGLSGMFFQMFAGVPTEDQEVLINVIDASTNEVFDTQKWPPEE